MPAHVTRSNLFMERKYLQDQESPFSSQNCCAFLSCTWPQIRGKQGQEKQPAGWWETGLGSEAAMIIPS